MPSEALRVAVDALRIAADGVRAGPSLTRDFLWLALPTLLVALVLSAVWELWLDPWLHAWLGSPLGHWQHIVVSTLLVLLALASSAGVVLRAQARQRATEVARQVTEARCQRVVEASPMGVHAYRLDPEGQLVFEGANPAADRILRLDHRQFVGLRLDQAFPSLAQTRIPERYRQVCRGGEPWKWDEVSYQDGRTAGVFEVFAFRTAPGEMVAMFQDVSARRRAEDAVQRSKERFRQLIESTRDWVWEVDPAGAYTYCSPQCQDLLGYRPEELIGRAPFDLMPPRDARRMKVLFGRLVAECKPIVSVENVNLHRDGHTVVLETSGVPFFDGSGQLLGYRGMDRDVTERHRAQEAIRALNAELEDRVRKRTAELEYAYRELEAFSYSVSHDLRAPLRGIDGFSLALLEDYGDTLDETARGYLERVRAGTRRMGLLIDELLTLSRVTRQEMHREPVDLGAIASEVGQELVPAADGRRVDLRLGAGLGAEGDPRLLRLVLTNLLENAWKFTARQAEPRVELGRRPDGAYFVRDNGAGFDMAFAHKLFAPFQRLHSADEFPGTGIGLAIVQRVVHRHGGRIWAEATPGEGATFYFTLPATEVRVGGPQEP